MCKRALCVRAALRSRRGGVGKAQRVAHLSVLRKRRLCRAALGAVRRERRRKGREERRARARGRGHGRARRKGDEHARSK